MADVYALCEQRRYEEAKSLIERMAAHAKAGRLIEEWYRVPMHVLNLHTGDRSDRAETANALRDEVRQAGHGFTRHMVLWHAVPLLAAKGDTEACFDLLELLSESRSLAYDHLVNHEGFESLRDDVRFQKLLQDSRAEFEDKLLVIDAAATRGELPEYIATRLPKLRAELQQKPSPARPPSFVSQSDIRMSQPGRFDRAAPASPDSTTGDAAPRSLAVLPLANLSGDPEQEFFVAGMHDALINELARLKALTVISRTSTMPFAGSTEPLPEIATRLGVEAVIEGSVLKAGNQVRINLQLVNAHPEKHLWADSFDGAMEDILDLHRRVAGEVSSAVRARLTADEEERLETTRKVDPQVYEIYLRARHVNVFVADDNWRGIRLYEEATARDPEFAPAYAGMARNYVYLATLGAAAPGDVLPLAAEAAQRAIELDPESGEARSIHGYTKLFLEWDWQTAGDEMKLAREMEPNNVAALCDSVLFLALTGSVDESVRIADRIVELDPISADALFWQGWARFLAERYEEAIEILHTSIAANPALPYPPLWIGAAYGMMGMAGEALTWARKAEALDPESRNTDFLAVLGATYVMGGESDETRRVLQRVGDLQTDDVRFPTQQGYLHGWLGEYDEAVAFYKIAFAERNPGVIFLGNHPVCDKPRSDPRIIKMVEGMGFPAIRPMLSSSTGSGDAD
jgi:TolB-like protein/Flp pilus assembly protein TadD